MSLKSKSLTSEVSLQIKVVHVQLQKSENGDPVCLPTMYQEGLGSLGVLHSDTPTDIYLIFRATGVYLATWKATSPAKFWANQPATYWKNIAEMEFPGSNPCLVGNRSQTEY